MVHKGEQINIAITIKGTEFRFAECIEAREPMVDKDPKSVKLWTRPPFGMVKLNVDAAIFSDKCWLAVVARDDRGNIVKYWSKTIPPNEPVVAEANVILWAIQIAKEEDFKDIIVERDAKIYFDVLKGNVRESLWSILSLCRDIKFIGQSFSSCMFNWVFREANSIAHSLAKFAAHDSIGSLCDCNFIPPRVKDTWCRDVFVTSC